MTQSKHTFQLVWGILLTLAGVGVVFRIPQIMPRIKQIEYFAGITPFIYFSFYLMAVILIGGGVKKIYAYFKAEDRGPEP
jgi:hypothetical protein